MSVIIGKISENEKKVKFDVEIHCTNCGKKVPGGLKAGEHTVDLDVAVNAGTGRFQTEVAILDVYEVPIERP